LKAVLRATASLALRRSPRAELEVRLASARALTDGLFALLTPEGLWERPIAERHRLIFYLGHLEAFDWNLLCRDALGQRSPADWPAPEAIEAFNRRAREAVDAALAEAPRSGWLAGDWAPHLAIEHRLMHAETLCYLLQRLGARFKRPGPLPDLAPSSAAQRWCQVPAGAARLGLERARDPFLGWDNEYPATVVPVAGFSLARLPVSNADWLAFLEAGGYRQRALWGADAWAWLQREQVRHPAFWRLGRDGWRWVAMFGEVPLPLDWPVYVSHAEATAYARWKGARLPTEAEWQLAAHGDAAAARAFPWEGPEAVAGVHGNFGALRYDPVASGRHPAGDSLQGVADLIGNGWEWTSTVFAPFPGFQALPFYPGYSASFFDGHHLVLKGASARTDASLLRPSFRNWYQPHYQHPFAKFRLVRDH
jgi:ergothioneine biosynthesis protein EgtB